MGCAANVKTRQEIFMKSNLIGRSIFALVLFAVGWAEPAIAQRGLARPPRALEFGRPVPGKFEGIAETVRSGRIESTLPDEPIPLSELIMRLEGGRSLERGRMLQTADIFKACGSSTYSIVIPALIERLEETAASERIISALKIAARRFGGSNQNIDDYVQSAFAKMIRACEELLALQNQDLIPGFVYKILAKNI
jgi:hypothetical protein